MPKRKISQDTGVRKGGVQVWVTHLNRIVRVDVSKKGTFSQTFEGDESQTLGCWRQTFAA